MYPPGPATAAAAAPRRTAWPPLSALSVAAAAAAAFLGVAHATDHGRHPAFCELQPPAGGGAPASCEGLLRRFALADKMDLPAQTTNSLSVCHPAVVDVDGDGDVDLFLGTHSGNVLFFENTAGDSTTASSVLFADTFTQREGASNPLAFVDVDVTTAYAVAPQGPVPAFADTDGDGDADLFVGTEAGDMLFFENTGSVTQPVFTARVGAGQNPVHGFDAVDLGLNRCKPSLADIDDDGDIDLFISCYGHSGDRYFENTGSVSQPVFTARHGVSNPLHGLADAYGELHKKPAFVVSITVTGKITDYQ